MLLAALLARSWQIGAAYLLAYIVVRLSQAWIVGVWGVQDEVLRRRIWLVPLYDAIHLMVWLASFASNRIVWGGQEFIMQKGRLVATGSPSPSRPAITAQPRR